MANPILSLQDVDPYAQGLYADNDSIKREAIEFYRDPKKKKNI